MKIKDLYIGQKVGFNFQDKKYTGMIKSFNESKAIVEFDDIEDSEVPIKNLIGVCNDQLP
jgi:hypothetical protein